mmetsp:Transcript_71849/g.150117  ORF Transcript_71849/g.150117 Transcript_71849/m.150117 type:complete len:311 (-) Transcript_71849:782-1714(-)
MQHTAPRVPSLRTSLRTSLRAPVFSFLITQLLQTGKTHRDQAAHQPSLSIKKHSITAVLPPFKINSHSTRHSVASTQDPSDAPLLPPPCITERLCSPQRTLPPTATASSVGVDEKDDDAIPSVVHHILGGGGELCIPLDDLVDSIEHVLLRNLLPACADRVHPRLSTHRAKVGTRAVRAQPREQLEADVAVAVHVRRVDLEDLRPPLEVRNAKLDAAVHAARTQQRGVQSVRTVGCHQHFDVTARVEAVKLVHNLKHRALYLVVTTRPIVEPRTTDGVNLVEEDDASLFGARHLEQLSHHSRTFSNVLLD